MPFPYLFPFYFSNPARTFVIWVDNVDVTDKTLLGVSLSYSFGAIGSLNISFESTVTIALNSVVKVYDTTVNTFIFSGTVRELVEKQQLYNRYIYNCVAHDYTRAIYDAIGITGTFSGTEKSIITQLFAAYCTSVIVGSSVITGNTTSLTLKNNSLSEALDSLGIAEGGNVWWVDPMVELHYGLLADWPHARFDFSDSPNFSTTYPYHDFEYIQDNISASASTTQVSLKTYYSGLKIGHYILITNSILGAPFTGGTYYITDISARLTNTVDTTIQWEYAVTLRDATTLPSIITGHGNNSKLIPRLWNLPTPTKWYHPANKKYVDDKMHSMPQVEPVRILDTVYQNTSGRVRFVIVCAVAIVQSDQDGAAGIQACVENDSTPTEQVAESSLLFNYKSGTYDFDQRPYLNLTFIVPPGYYYTVNKYLSGTGTCSLITWFEYDLG